MGCVFPLNAMQQEKAHRGPNMACKGASMLSNVGTLELKGGVPGVEWR